MKALNTRFNENPAPLIVTTLLLLAVETSCDVQETLNSSLQSSEGSEPGPEAECRYEGWQTTAICSNKYPHEIFKDVHQKRTSNVTKYLLGCCQNDSSEIGSWNDQAKNCRVTFCYRDVANLCETLSARYINGTLQPYRAVTTETHSCGNVAVCCIPGSVAEQQIILLGAEEQEFPHQVLVRVRNFMCGGTIFNKKFIITAAHCVVDDNGSIFPTKEVFIVAGTNINAANELKLPNNVYRAKSVIVHRNYSRLSSNPNNELGPADDKGRYFNDIALIELEKDLNFSEKVMALEIAEENFDPFAYSDTVVVIGWGDTGKLDSHTYLHKANLILRKDSDCIRRGSLGFNEYRGHENELLCAGGIRDGTVSRIVGHGDSGGPAICRNSEENPVLCGITSWLVDWKGCVLHKNVQHCNPSVFTEVSFYRRWIMQNAGKQRLVYRYQLYGEIKPSSDYPHQVQVVSTGAPICGGTLLQPDIVITAAHCAFDLEKDNQTLKQGLSVFARDNIFEVKVGQHLPYIERIGKSVKDLDVINKSIVGENRFKNDLAVLLLFKNVPINETDLPKISNLSLLESRRPLELAFPRELSKSGQIVERTFFIFPRNNCIFRLNTFVNSDPKDVLGANEACGVDWYSGGSICDRSLGGGLFCKGPNGKLELCGVQSYRTCMFTLPEIFIEISQYVAVLNQTLLQLNSVN